MPLPAATIITGQDEQTLCCWTRSGSIPTPAFDHVLVIARFAGGSTDTRTLALSSARWPRPAATTGGGA